MNVADSRPITDAPGLTDGAVTAGPTPSTRTVSLHLQSTRDEVSAVAVGITDPNGIDVGPNLTLSRGTATDGIWQATVDVPGGVVGNWSLNSVGVIDRLGVRRVLPDSDLSKITDRTWTTS